MTDQALDKLMRQVLIDSLALEEDSAEPADFNPSKRHQQQMKIMLKNPLGWYKRKTKPVWKLALRRVAVVLLVASLGFGSVMVVSPTARAAVIRWVVEWYETHIVYRYFGEDMPEGMPQYEITALPEGYAENVEQRIDNGATVSLWYENKHGDVILLNYTYMQEGAALLTDPDDGDRVSEILVNGCLGHSYVPDNPENFTVITWIDEPKNALFSIHALYEEQELLAMAESVALVKEKKQMPQYEIAVLPEGFTENVEERIQMPEYGRVLYENNDQQWLWLRYVYIQQGAASVINTEGAEVKPVKINGHTGQLFLSENFEEQDNTVTWIDEANRIQFTVDGHFDEKTLLTIAESVSPMEKKRLMPQYEISALPNGYRETDYVVLPSNVSAAYENDAGDMICFDYVYMAQGAAWQFETEGSEVLDVMVNGCKGQLLVPDDPANWTTLTWIDPKQNLQFCIDAVGDKDSVIRLAESIVLKDTSKGGNK